MPYKHEYLGCPYKEGCGVKYRNEFYCGTVKHLKCIEFQVLRDKESKGKCSECGGFRMGGVVIHFDDCSKSVIATTGVGVSGYYNKNE